MSQQYHRPREETRAIIIEAVASSPRPLTRTQIADALDRRKTPHLTTMIDELVDEGVLIRDVRVFRNGVKGYTYKLGPTLNGYQHASQGGA